MMKKILVRLGLTVTLALGVGAANASPANAYWDCVDYGGYVDCQWYEPQPYGEYSWECWSEWYECSPCKPCEA